MRYNREGDAMEKAILIVLDTDKYTHSDYDLEELKNLTRACHLKPVEIIRQKRERPTANFYIGSGKIDDIKTAIETHGADMLIFDDELSPSQLYNLEEAIDISIIDRTILILDIFARRARTKEAKLQVELAQSSYMLPRIIGLGESFSRQKSGTGSKGPGEQKLELDRRILRDNIAKLKKDLKDIVITRRSQRKRRKAGMIKTVSLVGYTNAGKSTLMNALLEKSDAFSGETMRAKDMPFATLETKTRKITHKDKRDFLVTDTVGFISRLPHHLIEAFKSTLEEITESSLIIHVIDVSDPEYERHTRIAEDVLKEIGVKDIPVLYVYNKMDKVKQKPTGTKNPHLFMSALNKDRIDELMHMIDVLLFSEIHRVRMVLPFDEGDIYNHLRDHAVVKKTTYENDGIHIDCELDDVMYRRYKRFIV